MGVSIVVGGQFGSEGKGKIARKFAQDLGVSTVVRVGGPNSGHTVLRKDGTPVIFQCLPTAAIDRDVTCVLPAGSYIRIKNLLAEILMSGIDEKRVKIHPNAGIITGEDMAAERGLKEDIGSTGSGTGAAVVNRVRRAGEFVRAKDVPLLEPYVCDTQELLRAELDKGREVLIEGTQGFGLSNLLSPYYPMATARDTTASGFLSEAGLSPFDVSHIIMVLRSFPIRVGGNSGPLPNEISWEKVSEIAGREIREYTSVTKKLRRVATFDPDIVRQAIRANQPDIIAMNHLDYIPLPNVLPFVEDVEKQIGAKINYQGFSPEFERTIF